MKKTARVFYTIAKWLQLAVVILCALGVVAATIWFIIALVGGGWEAGASAFGTLLGMTFYLAIAVACWIVVNVAIKKQKEDSKSKAPHIMCIVIGVFSNVCYLVGGILSLIMIAKGQEVEEIQGFSKEQVQSAVKGKGKKAEEKEEKAE